MNINPVQSYGRYQPLAKGTQKVKAAAVVPENTGKTDQISFRGTAVAEQRDISQLSRSTLLEMNATESASRLNAIQEAVENHTYSVSGDDLADAILERAYI